MARAARAARPARPPRPSRSKPAAKGTKAKPKAKPKPAAKPASKKAPKPAAKTGKAVPKPSPKPMVRVVPKRPAAPAAAAKPAAPPPKAAPGPSKAGKDKGASGDLSVAGQIYQKGKLVEGVLHVDSATGRILRVAKSSVLDRHLDLGRAAILPGAIDLHVHFRDPGQTHKEDIASGSTAAAFGGVTGFVDMPNTIPATTTLRALRDKMALMAAKSVVDWGVWVGGTWYTGELEAMLRHAVGVKTYLGSTTGDLLLEDLERFKLVLAAAGQSGRPVALHCEAQRILTSLRRTEQSMADHDQARPPLAEVEAIYDAMKSLAGLKKPPPVHVAHASSLEAIQAAASARFSVAVCPHHLLLDTTAHLSHAYGKVNPPLRSPAVREQLWTAFAQGKVNLIESDHAPHTRAEKEDNFHLAPGGMPGVETMVPLMLAQAASNRIDLRRVVDALTVNPARLAGAQDRGALEAGLRADFAVYDLKKPTKVVADQLHSACGWTPFEGHKAIFPSHTFLAGQPVVEGGQLVGKPGMGKSLVPQPKS